MIAVQHGGLPPRPTAVLRAWPGTTARGHGGGHTCKALPTLPGTHSEKLRSWITDLLGQNAHLRLLMKSLSALQRGCTNSHIYTQQVFIFISFAPS